MKLIDEIKNNWELDIYYQLQEIASLKSAFPAWTLKTKRGYGVAVLYDGDEIREDFSNATIYCDHILLNGVNKKVLILASKKAEKDPAFINLCYDFINPGDEGEYRKALIEEPVKWWASWKELLGNVSIDERVYDVIGELSVLKYYAEKGYAPTWNGPSQSSYDIETDEFFVEVKSSINRTKKEVTISSIYQLSNLEKNLYLVFCTFELTDSHGISINSLVEDLRLLGYNIAAINELLEKKGFGLGKSVRKKQFLLHSMYRYAVDDAFPKVIEQSFKGDTLPKGINDISYTVDLTGLDAENLIKED